ncbi:fungal-specific transcription factor domain-containing protein [Aspergillus karnatakaensis]|uniref:Zn(II)2Cys6 transcription factor n=1 Tax=Aspergillus karnatakaensis TaxID=1810916 RepID=UPI003CCCF2B2
MPRQSVSAGVQGEEPPRSKRPRAAQACDRCRSKKYKCDELYPCSHCKKSQIDCVYQGNYKQLENDRSASYVLDLENRVEELSLKLREAESMLSSSKESSAPVNATPSSMPTVEKPTPTPRHELEEPTRPSYANEEENGESAEDEITELNHHTNGIEFHGSTSSAAFLGHLQKARDPPLTEHWPSRPRAHEYSIVSTLHNAGFSPSNGAPQSLAAVHEHNYYFEQAHVFMSGYFENVHFIHPFINKEDFLLRAQDLWMRRTPTPDPCFIALYLSVLSFGALLRVWDEAQLGGLTRFEWSRKLFGEAQLYLNYLHFPNNLDAVQCLYLMAKICQNELNPNLAYMYLGLAIRTSLAAGFNRNVRHCRDPRSDWISKTWWGIYSLEIEMSFSLGRPDTLGLDDYHNRPLPPRDDSLHAIIPWMVDFARITRKVSVQIYHRRLTLSEKLSTTLAIEAEIDDWMAHLPDWLRPEFVTGVDEDVERGRNDLRDPKWARRQRLVLGIRYYNVKMLLFRPFLRHTSGLSDTYVAAQLSETVNKCLEAAERTIAVIHDIYRVHTFFRCWWYNTTYVTFATSTLLLPLSLIHSQSQSNSQSSSNPTSTPPSKSHDPLHLQTPSIHHSIEKAIEILEATDECVVARKCVEIIRFFLREFQGKNPDGYSNRSSERQIPRQDTRYDSSSSILGATEGAGADNGWYGRDTRGPQTAGGVGEFDMPDWAYGFGFPEYSFEGITRFFDELGGLPVVDQ